jgi:hypothetical protein
MIPQFWVRLCHLKLEDAEPGAQFPEDGLSGREKASRIHSDHPIRGASAVALFRVLTQA